MERTGLHFWQKGYWSSAVGELKSLRTLCLAALFAGLVVVTELIFIPVGENLRVMFSYLLMALGGAIYGPVVSMLVGFVADILGATLFPSGAFFFGYTLSAIVGALIYGLFLYRQRITIVRLALCKLCVNVIANMVLNSIWSAVLYGKGYWYYLAKSVIKNLVLLPVEVILLALLFGALMPVLQKRGVTVRQRHKIIDLW